MDQPTTLALLLERVIDGAETRPDRETVQAILAEAARFSDRHLVPLAPVLDRDGCRLDQGRVITAPGHLQAWRAFAEGGWTGLTVAEDAGGQALPLAVATAAQELFDAADPAFGMLSINGRCAARLLTQHGDAAMRDLWLPRLATGEWGATICISEPQAGSDVGRIATRAKPDPDGGWRLTGQKCWISYGDHDLTSRIGHFTLARSAAAQTGTRGLSLFLVPDRLEDGTRNGVSVTRIEKKIGLHGSPTCSIAFENSSAEMIGPAERGLPTLFAMIVAMRLGVAAQGAGVAQAAAAVAERYAQERGQGGDPADTPVPISDHAEVRALLLGLRMRAEAARLIALQAAAWIDAGDAGDAGAGSCGAMMLPVAKTYGAEAAFANASDAIQVLGGAGCVNDWPVERMLRDCRVFSIYEGTTAIQGLDLLLRRTLGPGGLTVLANLLERLLPQPSLAEAVLGCATKLSNTPPRAREHAAVPFIRLLGMTCADGLLRRASRLAGPLSARYAALIRVHETETLGNAARLVQLCGRPETDDLFQDACAFAE